MDNKTRIIGIRVEETVFNRLDRMEQETGMEKVSLARTALMAVLDDYEKTHVLNLPLRITSSGDRPPPSVKRAGRY